MISSNEAHSCHGQSMRRTAAVLFNGADCTLERFEQAIEEAGGRYINEMSIVLFDIGKHARVQSAADLKDYLVAQWADCSPTTNACWVDPVRPLYQQYEALGQANDLELWAEHGTSPIVEILSNGEIETWFQPVFNRNELTLWGYECLARARNSDGELIPPVKLFQWAKQEGLIFMLDRVCREKHIENTSRIGNLRNLNILINFLPTVIYDPKVCLKTTFKAAKRSGIDPKQVIFEVVETEKVRDHGALKAILDEYRRAGFRVALDDVGSGHSGLTLLGDISPDLIKIDRILVSKSTESALHCSICRSIVGLARETGKLVLAEGVETEAEYALFHDMGVDLFQGYLFGRPDETPASEALVSPIGAADGSQRAA